MKTHKQVIQPASKNQKYSHCSSKYVYVACIMQNNNLSMFILIPYVYIILNKGLVQPERGLLFPLFYNLFLSIQFSFHPKTGWTNHSM